MGAVSNPQTSLQQGWPAGLVGGFGAGRGWSNPQTRGFAGLEGWTVEQTRKIHIHVSPGQSVVRGFAGLRGLIWGVELPGLWVVDVDPVAADVGVAVNNAA
ncbi:hypothetical protein GCM10010464_35830 [Pseudonocardia yunnanensis]